MDVLAIQLCGLDVEEMLGLADGRLLVCGLEALRIGLATKIAAHLPIPTGIGLEDPQLGGVVGYWRYRLLNG